MTSKFFDKIKSKQDKLISERYLDSRYVVDRIKKDISKLDDDAIVSGKISYYGDFNGCLSQSLYIAKERLEEEGFRVKIVSDSDCFDYILRHFLEVSW